MAVARSGVGSEPFCIGGAGERDVCWRAVGWQVESFHQVISGLSALHRRCEVPWVWQLVKIQRLQAIWAQATWGQSLARSLRRMGRRVRHLAMSMMELLIENWQQQSPEH